MEKLLKSIVIIFMSFFLLLDAQALTNSSHFLYCESSETKSEKNQECSFKEDYARLSKFSLPNFTKLSKISLKITHKELWTGNSQNASNYYNIDRFFFILPLSISASPVLRI